MNPHDTNGNNQNGNRPSGYPMYDPAFLFEDESSLKDFIPVLWRGKLIIILIALIVFNLVLVYTLTREPEYEAVVSVYINTKSQQPSILTGLIADDTKHIGNELELLKSRLIAESVAQRLMEQRYLDEARTKPMPVLTYYDYEEDKEGWAPEYDVIKRLRESVSFSPVRDSDFIKINARSSSNIEAALIANTFAQVYYDRNFYLSRARSRNVREFLEEQLEERRRNLDRAEQAMQDYMQLHGVVMIDNESKRVIDQLSDLEAQREATDVEIQSLSNTLESMRAQLAEQEPNVARSISSADNPYIRMIQEQMAELQVERDLTLTQNPEAQQDERYRLMIKEIDEQLEVLRENLHRRTAEFMESLPPGTSEDPTGFIKQLRQRILETDVQLQGLRFKRNAINESLARYEQQFEQLPQVSMDYARLQRARASNEKIYLMIEERYNEAMITEQSEFGSVDIIDRAVIPDLPVSPKIKLNLLLGLLLGFGFGVGFVLVREKMYAKIQIPEDLQKNGYDTLTSVSLMNHELKEVAKRNGHVRIKDKNLDPHLITVTNPLSPTAEAFRLLRTNLRYAQVDHQANTIVLSSPNPGEGKTTVVSNMAISYAHAGEKTLLIDADLRRPSIAETFDLVDKPGLTEVLANEVPLSEAVQESVVENLDILTSGSIPANPAEILGSNKMKSLLDMLSRRYAVVLIDSPPILAASDPLVLSKLTDGIVLVVASGKTTVKELDLARDSLKRIGSRIIGVALNFFNYRQAYGSSYKYKYYRYGKYGYSTNGDGNKLKEVKVD
jgi:capsular exopolysaccharide synthesis family protein